MNIGIYDVDSTIPNLALMKISAYHKSQGHNVSMYHPLFIDEYDKIYASKIFKFSDGSGLIPERMDIGGTGISLTKTLPQEIENQIPDYTLYDYPHNIGFSMRGCRMKCDFCVVPKKEGRPKQANTIAELWTQRESDFLVLLDNDFFGNSQWQDRIYEMLEFNLKVCFSQGLNIRKIKQDQAEALASVKFRNLRNTARQVYFAWDNELHEVAIHRGLKTCFDAGIKPREMAFYVLVGFDSTHDQDMYRVMTLRDYGCDPYVMPYNKSDVYQRKFARWVNHKAIFKSVSWGDYSDGIKKRTINVNQGELL